MFDVTPSVGQSRSLSGGHRFDVDTDNDSEVFRTANRSLKSHEREGEDMKPRDLTDHVPYRAGRGATDVARSIGQPPSAVLALASNENPLGPSPAAVATIREDASEVGGYPKSVHVDLTEALARRWTVDPTQVWLANGGDGAIDYLSRAHLDPGDGILAPSPGFAYYGMSARFHHGTVSTYELSREANFEDTADAALAAYEDERIVFLTSPHNPTGVVTTLPDVERVAAETGEETLVVVDEAYGEFADVDSAVALIEGRDGFDPRDDVAVVRTFSKAYGLAGLRLGYAVTPIEWADAYARVNSPFAAGTLSCRAGLAALEDEEHLERSIEVARTFREFLRKAVAAPVLPSQANFVLVEVGDGATVADRLRERGVVVRDCTSFGLPDCVRISAAEPSDTERVVEALNEVLSDLADASASSNDGHRSTTERKSTDSGELTRDDSGVNDR